MKAEILICDITDFVFGVKIDGKLLEKDDWKIVKANRWSKEEECKA